MSIRPHIIRKQRIEIDFPQEMETARLPHIVGDVFDKQLRPAMEKLFDECSNGVNTLVFDRIELDCGVLDDVGWEDQLAQRALSQLREKLREGFGTAEINAQSLPLEVWIRFLERGYLVWDSPVRKASEFEQALVLNSELLARFLFAVRGTPGVLGRFLHVFSPVFRAKLMDEAQKLADEPYLDQLLNHLPASWKRESWFQGAVLTVLARRHGVIHGKKSTLSMWADALFSWVPVESQARACQAIAALYVYGDAVLGTAFFAKHRGTTPFGLLEREVSRYRGGAISRWQQEKAEAGIQRTKDEEESRGRQAKDRDRSETTEIRPHEEKPAVDDEGIFIENAGLVLVHPFLNPLFETLGWTGKGTFVDAGYAALGTLLLQFMAQGNEPVEEAMLPLNKVLCGLLPSHFVDVTVQPDKIAKKEAEKMLQAVVGHWEVLKNTSIDGLRETFLRRPGKLERKEEAWVLQVETKAADVLLNQLPWGINVLKLPWASMRLQVNWI